MDEKLKILQMLQEGQLTVDQASELLEAVASPSSPPAIEPAKTPVIPPNLGRFRRLAYIPFAAALILFLLTGWGTYVLYHRTGGRITVGFVAMVTLFVVAALAALLTFWMTTAPWLHVRIQSAPDAESRGQRLAISLPLPLTLAGWILPFAYRFVDQETAGHLDTAAVLVATMKQDLDTAAVLVATMKQDLGKPGSDPVVVEVDDEGEHVQVYLG